MISMLVDNTCYLTVTLSLTYLYEEKIVRLEVANIILFSTF